jgi:hypothetical protein
MRMPDLCHARTGLRAVLSIAALLLRTTSAHAQDGDSGPTFRGFDYQGIELMQISGGATQLPMENGVFVGSGRLVPGGPLTGFRATGRELGLIRPWGGEFELGIRYLPGPLIFGGLLMPGGLTQDGVPAESGIASLANARSVSLLAAGAEAGIEARLPPFRLRLLARLGYRWLSVPMDGFAVIGKSPPSATYGSTWSQVRIEAFRFLTLGDAKDHESGFGFGVFVAEDIQPAGGFSAGLTMVMRLVFGPRGV